MLYLHDVWVNWFEGEENGYNVSHYHEWRTDDKIELIECIPVMYIRSDLFDFIENSLEDLPEQLLREIFQKTYIRQGHKKITVDYACILTDGKNTMAIDTVDYSIPIRKSRLMPRQDKVILDMIKNVKPRDFQFNPDLRPREYHLLSLNPHLVLGLTRKEKQFKQLLMMALDHLRMSNNLKELRYWLIEWKPELSSHIDNFNRDEAWNTLYEDIKRGWSPEHESFAEKLMKGNPFLGKLWEHELTKQINEPELS